VGSESAAAGIGLDDGHCAVRWEILWPEVCILESVPLAYLHTVRLLTRLIKGWAKYMEWMYPVEVRFTNKTAFKAAGAVEAAATL
jgi:hypothetical protein